MDKITYRRKQHKACHTPEECRRYAMEFQAQQGERIRSDPEYREANLFDAISDERFLWCGWEHVQENSGACGIDGESVECFDAVGAPYKIHKLSHDLRGDTYEAFPLRTVSITKPDGGDRELHLPVVVDRVVMASANIAMEELVRARFRDLTVHGFIPGRGPQTAITAIRTSPIARKANYAAHLDVVKFFDRIQQERLRKILGRYMDDKRAERLIMSWVKTGYMKGDVYVPSHEGVPQGSPLSPALANIYLEEFDRWMSSREMVEKYGLFYLRYADNLLLLSECKPDGLILAVKDRLAQYGLQVKGKIGGGNGWKRIVKPWPFLGFIIQKSDEGDYIVRPNPDRIRLKVEAFKERRQRTERHIRRAAQGLVRYHDFGDAEDLREALCRYADPVEALERWLNGR